MDKLVPQNPSDCTVIRKVTDNILTFSAPFKRFGRIKIGGRGTVARLPSGALAVFSPVALTPETRSHLDALGGRVKYISALDFEHHLFLGPWHKEFPEATVIGVEGLPEKRESQFKDDESQQVRFDVVFTKANKESQKIDPEFDAEFDYEYVDGHGNKELVFNYKRERTLIQGDLMFNLPALEQYSKSNEDPHTGVLTKIFTYINSTSGAAVAQRRFIWYATSSADRPSFNKSIGKINGWDFERIIPCHGDVIEQGGKGIFRKVFGWHLQALQGQ